MKAEKEVGILEHSARKLHNLQHHNQISFELDQAKSKKGKMVHTGIWVR